ncbi:uncharacterized protein KQ657_002366 [Scheffersomyces spartinae]|uniref:Anaphase-promoting complex subunit 4 n=1 Tax=Scheffersomyces spartinae TaxID=45513 RepID=A0A9P8ALD8_9ASCO|nr:uncharacterized protein KQ657_002366 [Scheffersomyces spartinae]KAG7195979.1 hypothetical protein KQ657_002366 [Scheffersomyces spartinae]
MTCLISNGKLVGRPDGVVFEWCVELSLLFVSMNRMSIWVFRINGERIYSINNRAPIVSLTFLHNGTMFAVNGTDNVIKVYDSNTGKSIGIIGGVDVDFRGISCMNWVSVGGEISVPLTPFHIDVMSQMPKLHEESDVSDLNTLVVLDSQRVYFNFNNVFTIAYGIPNDDVGLIKHIGSVSITNNLFLTSKGQVVDINLQDNDDNMVYTLKKVIGWSCLLVSLHRMVHEQLELMYHEIKAFLVLFDRYLSNMENPVQLYHILLTNRVPLESHDYWFNVLGEGGLKRLRKQGETAYETIRNKLFYLTTILDRMVIIMSRMKGLYLCHRDEIDYGLENIIDLTEYTQNMIKYLYQLLHQCNKEQEMFISFLNWVKTVIIDENEGKSFDYLSLVEYFNDGLYNPTISKYFKVDDLEAMKKNELAIDILSYSEAFLVDLKAKLLANISKAFTDKLQITSPISLDIGEVLDPDFVLTSTWHNEFGYVIVMNGSYLTMVQFPLFGSIEIKQKSLPINFNLIEYKLDSKFTYMLYEIDGIYKMDVVDINKAISCSEEDKFPRTSIGQVQMISKPEMIAVKSGLCGILDGDRQTYVFVRDQQFRV